MVAAASSLAHVQTDLPQLLASALVRSSGPQARHLRFEIQPEAVVLTGVVASYYQKQLAQESLRPYLGQHRLCNEIIVAR